MQQVYFDNAATTPMRSEVVEAISEVMRTNYGNASSSHSFGRSAKVLVEKARKTIAGYLNCSAGEIVFTSGGTEADNLILRSAVRDLKVKHIVTSKIEHHAILHTVQALEKEYGIQVSYVNLDANGDVDYLHLETLLDTEEKTLVSLMHINNEIGNITDIKRISDLCKTYEALFHSDAVQSVGHYSLNLEDVKVDFLAASAHKFHGPKGIGFVYVRRDSGLKPSITGGEQERGLRAGTESIHNIVGMETAFKLVCDNLDTEQNYLKELKTYFIEKASVVIPDVSFNGQSGSLNQSTNTILNLRLPNSKVDASMILFQLDLKGIACSRGSACQSGSSQKSHVLSEILNSEDLQKPSLRFSFSIFNTKEEVDYVIGVLKHS
ncbi:cysteine desulfurase family protein [Aestuariibaculum lutulentum]|uniref:cysteine desulfurase n=1 Tax=Aestuariibaculum lutulentum TaxID=2920935 RepID=A0ABS9RIN0_9FLAO|nr:cysteine desulfurase family protein [Aestuariibaculum lutulentum]MCH4552742.1 cysteine desulfurase [Aestuariibaculum lutulentum]